MSIINAKDFRPEEKALRRPAVVRISAELLMHMFTTGTEWRFRVERGIPPGARVIGAKYDAMADCWDLALESETFEPVIEAAMPPSIEPIIFTLEK